MWNPDPRCKHNTPIAQTQCKACMNDEIIELRSKLQACELQRDEWKKYADAGLSSYAELQAEVASYSSRLQECQKYWDDEKRRYDAADKGFRLVCDERDSLSRRLSSALMHARSLYDCCPGELDVMVLRLIETLEPPSKCDHDWQPDEGQWQKCSRCGAIQHPAVDLLDQRKRLVERQEIK